MEYAGRKEERTGEKGQSPVAVSSERELSEGSPGRRTIESAMIMSDFCSHHRRNNMFAEPVLVRPGIAVSSCFALFSSASPAALLLSPGLAMSCGIWASLPWSALWPLRWLPPRLWVRVMAFPWPHEGKQFNSERLLELRLCFSGSSLSFLLKLTVFFPH